MVTITTGDGNNSVYSDRNGAGEAIYLGNGKNTVVTSNRNSTIIGGGNDFIRGFDADDTLRIVGSGSSGSIISDGDLIFDFDDGAFTLAGVSSVESLNIEYVDYCWSRRFKLMGQFVGCP